MADMLPKLFFQHFEETSFAIHESGHVVAFLIGFVSQTHPEQAYIHFIGVHQDYRRHPSLCIGRRGLTSRVRDALLVNGQYVNVCHGQIESFPLTEAGEMDLGRLYLDIALGNFGSMKKTADGAMEQLNLEELHWSSDPESNTIARIVKHMAGNMMSRWTDFLTTDGEKLSRNRDDEFEGGYASRDEMMAIWETGWEALFRAVGSLEPGDLLKTVTIRAEPNSVIQAIERQVYHLSYHTGQIVYLAKQIKGPGWKTLTIPRGRSREYLASMQERFDRRTP